MRKSIENSYWLDGIIRTCILKYIYNVLLFNDISRHIQISTPERA